LIFDVRAGAVKLSVAWGCCKKSVALLVLCYLSVDGIVEESSTRFKYVVQRHKVNKAREERSTYSFV